MTEKLGLYVHWPYCLRICPYCDFNVYKAANADGDGLFAAMRTDLERWRERTGARRLASLHFGGGTPSLMTPVQIATLIEDAGRLFGFDEGAEIGLEANPKEAASFAGIASAGVERLSLGVQAFDDASLRALGRDHSANEGLDAIEAAQSQFARVSIDLIYARENQTPDGWRAELERALGLGLRHLSLYQLTIEPGTAFDRKVRRGALIPPEDDAAADMFALTQDVTEAAGLCAYEISNHAASRADQSVHNRIYWEGGDWIGVGPGAHSRLGRADRGGRLAAAAALKPADYAARAAQGSAHDEETLSPEDEAAERILMGVRLVEDGFDPAKIEALTGQGVDRDAADRFVAQGLLERVTDGLRLTRAGRLYADRIANALAGG
ncbi:MAG: radical SAM family heme chaperone HemW [Oceanicaulis sp.]